ncbi:deoxyribodipyrimidine photo-lyase [Arenicella chitinivorans]|uniref:Deoxyribodipyrimidine photo-lyase n=1 Tax=Arenicella chitinivorans TaxID=1329800 RepID=A0A918VIB8_9GAMM|nr:cryptochrome/photolyase family protein [Arenicella chitinivorans]GHA01095.1 deoxyribodipyrimidine photo-lyase [Arenicella chitinivorans]
MSDVTLRLILGDQLNASHSWYRHVDDNVVYLIAELHQEQTYVKHHIQKITAFFAAMKNFAQALSDAGHRVHHLTLDDTQAFEDLPDLLRHWCEQESVSVLEYQRPDEYRLLSQLRSLAVDSVSINEVDTEHFMLPFDEIDDYFDAGSGSRMETFYRKMRIRFGVLMDGDDPVGGEWNYDTQNRNKLKPDDLAAIPEPLVFENDVNDIFERLNAHKIQHFGEIGDRLRWPTTRHQSRKLLDFFCARCLPNFGTFQDAMTAKSDHAWSLYHARISFSLNTKMLSPQQVIDRVLTEFSARPDAISIAQVEGFIRQILGWREFVRGIYWINMPDYAQSNTLQANRELPDYFWTGKTKMRCLQQSLGQSLEFAYAHHIQRLMVIGNFCLLAGIDPDQVDAWYLGVYIDAIEWVEMPNTRGMCQYADGGLLASKPYSASGAYINRMSDYCSGCHYTVKEKVGDKACPLNSLYWHFMHRHRDEFGRNPRIGMVYRNLDKMDEALREKTLQHAEQLLANLGAL